ncbi:sine oculis-binding protein homolog B [Sardina pilchardus]|uniref:sine oculis-binding protein homolog B n=1 Tax=Sardina pilchardus TaxID=27697 RepID=UPI002E14C6BF
MREMEAERPSEIKRSRKPARPVKRELNSEMKSFAESTMNELLGWYGYEELDLRDVSGAESRKPCVKRHVSVLRETSVQSGQVEGTSVENESLGAREGVSARSNSSPTTSSSSSDEKEARATHVIVPLIKPSAVEEVQNVLIVCVWCQREGVRRFSLLMGRQLKSFCSEKCFFACRRAHFKRNKANDSSCHGDESPGGKEEEESAPVPKMKSSTSTKVCDWCKRLQPTHEYVATGTGDERLHFCSSECVNQYKMDVFYREARAALTARQSAEDRAAEVKESKVNEGSPPSPLLTPASWTSGLRPTPSPNPPPASSSSASYSSSASVSASASASASAASASEPISACQRTSLCHPSVSSSSHPPFSLPSQERFAITRVPVPPLPPLVRPQTPHTLPRPSHTPPLASSHTHSPSRTPLAVAHAHTQPAPITPAHPRPSPVGPPAILMPAFPGAPMMHWPPGCPPMLPPRMPPHPPAPRFVVPVPSLPPPFPQNTILVPYPIIIPLPVPVPIPIPILLPAGERPSHTSPAADASPVDRGDAGVCVKAESPSSPHTHAADNTHSQVQAAAEEEAHSGTHSSMEEEDGGREKEKDQGETEEERETEAEEEEEEEEEDDKKPTMNGQREEWRERWRERRVIQSVTPTPLPVVATETDDGRRPEEEVTVREPAWSSGQHTLSTHTASNPTVLKRHTLSPHTHVIHLTHAAQTAVTHAASTHTHASSAVQEHTDQTCPSHSPHIIHTSSSHTHLISVPRVATCADSQTVAMPTDSSHKLSPPPESTESQSEELKENCIWNGRNHEVTDSQAHQSDGSRGAEEEGEEQTDVQQTSTKHTHVALKRAHTQTHTHTQSLQERSEAEPEEKRGCLQIRDQNA